MEIGLDQPFDGLALRFDFGAETWLRSRGSFQTSFLVIKLIAEFFNFEGALFCDEIFGFVVILMSNVPFFTSASLGTRQR